MKLDFLRRAWLKSKKELEKESVPHPTKVDSDRCSLFHPLRGVCGAGNPNICGHCGKHKNEHE